MTLFRISLLLGCLLVLPAWLGAAQDKSAAAVRDGQHDFDFEIGSWKTHLWRLQRPLSHSRDWVEYRGDDGSAQSLERTRQPGGTRRYGPAGHIEALSLRLYNPQSGQWSLNFASSRGGTMATPTIGEFRNGRGEFYNQETINDRTVLVRFIISDVKPDSCRFEQAFSDDGGKTWEVNWIALDTRTATAQP